MNRFAVPKRASEISDRSLWSAIRPKGKASDTEHLRTAKRHGAAGRNDDAYAALAEHHRRSLAGEWKQTRDRSKAAPAPKRAVLDDLLNHKITTWHTQVVQFGRVIDWAPASLSSDSKHGFHYMFWYQPAVTAFVQTGEPALREFIADIAEQYYFGTREHERWKDELPAMLYGGLGIAGKFKQLLAGYLALINSGPVSPRTVEAFIKLFLGFGRSLDHQLVEFVPANNAFAVMNSTLLHLSLAFPEFAEAPAWRRKATRYLVELARHGFYPDGGNRERVWGYGMMHVSALADAYELARPHGGLGAADKTVLRTLRLAYQWYAKTSGPQPHRFFPTYGDAGIDNGMHQILARGSTYFPKDKPGRLFGIDRAKSVLLPDSGFAILRNGDAPDSTHINISTGEFAGWHSHWDLLSMNFWAKGERLLEELCRFGPYANPLDTLFREPQSHNLVLIDGMIYDSREVRAQDVQWHSDDRIDYFSATHRAYRYYVYGREGQNVSPNMEGLVRRTVVLVKDAGYAVVMDSVSDINHPGFNRAISQYWHSPFKFEAIDRYRVRTAGESACLLVHAPQPGLWRQDTFVDHAGEEIAHLGHGHDRYGLRTRRWMDLSYTGIMGFTTVIYPFAGATPDVSVRCLAHTGPLWKAEAIEVSSPAGQDVIVLNPEKLADFAVDGRRVRHRAVVTLSGGRGESLVR